MTYSLSPNTEVMWSFYFSWHQAAISLVCKALYHFQLVDEGFFPAESVPSHHVKAVLTHIKANVGPLPSFLTLRNQTASSWPLRWTSLCRTSWKAVGTQTNSWQWWWVSPPSPTEATPWCRRCGRWCSTFSLQLCRAMWNGLRTYSCSLSWTSCWTSVLTRRRTAREDKISECICCCFC